MALSTKSDELVEFERRARCTCAYLDQGDVWVPKDRAPVRVAEMDPEWRYNASRWLERRAPYFETLYTFGELLWMTNPTMREVIAEVDGVPVEHGPRLSHMDMMGEHAQDAFNAEQERRGADPVGWIRTTRLYRALVADLPSKRRKLAKLADRARHWSTCPVRAGRRDCRCAEIAAAERPDVPEWTLS